MDQVNFQDNNSQSLPKSPLKLVHSDINNVEKSEMPTANPNEINMSPSKPLAGDNDQHFSEKHFSTSINGRNGKISPDQLERNPNENYNQKAIDKRNNEIHWKIETRNDDSNSTDKQNGDELNIGNFNGKYNVKNEIIETQHQDYELSESKPNLDINFSGQSSENPSPILHGSDFQDYNLESGNANLDDQYMSNRFFIDDTNESDHIKYSDNNINLFELTPDQQLAIRELELRKPQSDFEDDYDYSMNYDNIPDYDVKDKLESLNAQLANEPSPPDPEHRNSRVAFKEELVSLVAPFHEYSLSENEQEEYNDTPEYIRYDETRNGNRNVIEIESPISLSRENYENAQPNLEASHTENSSNVLDSYNYETENIKSEQDPEPISQTKFQSEFLVKSQPEKTNETKFKQNKELHLETNLNSEEKNMEEDKKTVKASEENSSKEKQNDYNSDQELGIVVSRGGNFHLMDQSDMVDSSGNIVNPDEEILETTNQQSRPISAPSTKGNRNEIWSSMHTGSSNGSVRSEMNYQSKTSARPNSMVPKVDRELLQRQKEKEEKRKKEQQERDEIELKNKREMNEKCFNAWLQNKNKTFKEETERKKKEEEEERKQQEKIREENKAQEIETLKELAKNKELQKRREEKLRQYRIKEMEQTMVIHTESERNKAFREWIKKKRLGNQMKQKEEKQKARITRLAMRQCRKSQNLAQAIHQANSFRYLDFLGYP